MLLSVQHPTHFTGLLEPVQAVTTIAHDARVFVHNDTVGSTHALKKSVVGIPICLIKDSINNQLHRHAVVHKTNEESCRLIMF